MYFQIPGIIRFSQSTSGQLRIVDIQKSKDGTIKFLLELKDKRNVETVLIPDKNQSRYTICLSLPYWLSQKSLHIFLTYAVNEKYKDLIIPKVSQTLQH